jgi:hypothetical protein
MRKSVTPILIAGLVFFSRFACALTYTTNFPNTENPLSEQGHWKNGGADGIDWTNCRTSPGLVIGVESGRGSNQYDDSTCILAGAWGPLQTVQATVFTRNQSRIYFQEVELRLRSTITAHRCIGYEVLFRAYHPGGYATIVRWNGPLGKFTYLNQKPNGKYNGIQNGDVVKATIDGNGLIIGYVNGVEVIRAIDTTYTSGNPGVGFWLEGKQGVGTNADYGFSAFTATDGVKTGVKADQYMPEGKGTAPAAVLARASRPGASKSRLDEIVGLLIPFRNYGETSSADRFFDWLKTAVL